MISLKKYWENSQRDEQLAGKSNEDDLLSTALRAYGAVLLEIGNSSLEACPGLGDALKRALCDLVARVSPAISNVAMAAADAAAREQVRTWGRNTAKHYQEKTCEVKDLLLTMARTAESVSTRDRRCAGHMQEVTARLKAIASLEDLTQIRASIEKSATELRTSIDRMAAEGKAVLDQMQERLSTYQTKLEEAEELASRDVLTGLSSRLYMEGQIEKRMAGDRPLCVAILDIDGFKKVNDDHGHLVGDELLKQFGGELRSTCRAMDLIGRWGGDEFILLFDCGLEEAETQIARLRKWVCGDYTVRGRSAEIKVRVEASMGLAERLAGEEMKTLLERADAAMYADKASGNRQRPGVRQSAA